MSAYDDRREADEATAPMRLGRDEPPPFAQPFPPHQAPYGQPPYGPPGFPGYPPPRSKVPGWIWPVVAATALFVGLAGGVVGGIAVNMSDEGGVDILDAGPIPDAGAVPAPLDPENGSVAAVAKKLLPSTVQIAARERTAGGDLGSNEAEPRGATGSGFVLDRRGHVITNNHVVEGAAGNGRIQVIDQDGKVRDAEIVGRSPVYDIAVLDVEGNVDGLRPAAIGASRTMNVGETVVAIGSPLGLNSTVTSGIVSAVDRPVTTGAVSEEESSYINAVQTDAAINPGNSGGPLVNLRGQVVGVNSAIATTGGFGSGPGNIGVGFAIPMEQVRITTAQILQTGEAEYPVIGASVITGGEENNGAQVSRVPDGTPADNAGLRKGDRVTAIDGEPVTDGIALIVAIRSHQPGEKVTLSVKRDGDDVTMEITLDAEVG